MVMEMLSKVQGR